MRVTVGFFIGSLLTLTAACNDLAEPPDEEITPGVTPAVTGSSVGITNLRATSGRAYQIVPNGAVVGAKYYIDRSYRIVSPVPGLLQGLPLIRTANADRAAAPGSSRFLTFSVDRSAIIYVAHDDRTARPEWLKSGFQDTGVDLLTAADVARRMSIFRRTVAQGTVTLGSNVPSGRASSAMYVVAVASSAESPPTPPSDPSPPRSGWQVTPGGSSSGQGTASSPWSLSYALGGAGGRIQPGDTVWLRGGTYSGFFSTSLSGTSSAPIIFRGYPGERPKIDGGLSMGGRYIWVWGWEVIDSRSGSYNRSCIDMKTLGGRLINNILHDCSGNGAGAWWDGPNQELTGNLVYNNGRNTPHVGHGIYTNNETGSKLYRDNVVFLNAGYGFHGYETVMSCLCNMTFRGNASFQNGMRASGYGGYDFFVGGSTPTRNLTLDDNYNYRNLGNGNRGLLAGDEAVGGTQNQDLHAHRGIFVGNPSVIIWRFSTVDTASIRKISVGSFPTTGTTVLVRPNPYEKGRGHVVVYNWGQAGSVSADLSSVLAVGKAYSIYSVQRLFGAPVATGTYGGGRVSIPMANIPAPRPLVAGKMNLTPPATGPRFDVFLVVPR
jgi:hypothetical protein